MPPQKRRNLDTAPEPGSKLMTEKEEIRGYVKLEKKKKLQQSVNYTPTNRKR